MSYHSLGSQSYISMVNLNERWHEALPLTGLGGRGLGDVYDDMGCRHVAEFNACDNQQFAAAQQDCYAIGPFGTDAEFNACVQQHHDDRLPNNCLQYCPNTGTGTRTTEDYPWMTKSPETGTLQANVNALLPKYGFCLIGTDGKLGPATCGAAQTLYDLGETDLYVPDTCQNFTAPARCAGTPVKPVTPTCDPATQELIEGKCYPLCTAAQVRDAGGNCIAKPPPPGAQKSSMMWVGLLGLVAVGAFAMSQGGKGKRRKNRRRNRRSAYA